MATTAALASKEAAPKAPAQQKPAAKALVTSSSTKKEAASATIALKAVFAEVAVAQGVDKKQADALLACMVDSVTDHLKKGDRIRMGGLGILEVRNREARMGRNPGTGEAIQIAASKKISFRPAKELKDAV